ncbi:hypothetical protein AYO38_06250 [bacterium SCGC AG-212-C10]|nr:hypothetical protein AYO38_06190 [bacterium SCGC AG-212-C10]OAI40215.1 hypothetical protein AYO38_06250 [bacterium SCGC AG-212-C10]
MDEPRQLPGISSDLETTVIRALEESYHLIRSVLDTRADTPLHAPSGNLIVIPSRLVQPIDTAVEHVQNAGKNVIIIVGPGVEQERDAPAYMAIQCDPQADDDDSEEVVAVAVASPEENSHVVPVAQRQQPMLDGITLDLARQRASYAAQPIPLTRQEFMLFAVLVRRIGQVLSPDEIMDEIGNGSRVSRDDAAKRVKVSVLRLRRKLSLARVDSRLIMTVRGVGYMIDTPRSGTADSPGDYSPIYVRDEPTSRAPRRNVSRSSGSTAVPLAP